MLRQLHYATVCFFLFCAGPVAAAEISVAPGNGTLAAAVADAADGDTLILSDGGYYGNVVVNKSLTIRPVNRATDAIIADPVTIEGAGITVTLQGLKFNDNVILNQAAAIRLLENTWLAGNIVCGNYKTGEGDGSLVVVGNHLISGIISTVNSDNAYIAGNLLLNGTIYTASSAWIVGNDIERSLNDGNVNYAVHSNGDGAIVRILGNRLSCSDGYPIQCLYAGASNNLVANNLVQVDDWTPTSTIQYTQYGIVASGSGVATVVNNVVRGIPEDANKYGYGIQVDTGGATVTGNIVVDYSGPGALYVTAPTATVTYNLCFNNTQGCSGGEGSLDVDPRFVDLVDFELASDSPAIDAGPPDYTRADLDRTRNDMGVYGGPWSIGQYDAQRDPYNFAPYVYPLIKADAAPGGGTLEIEALGVAKLR